MRWTNSKSVTPDFYFSRNRRQLACLGATKDTAFNKQFKEARDIRAIAIPCTRWQCGARNCVGRSQSHSTRIRNTLSCRQVEGAPSGFHLSNRPNLNVMLPPQPPTLKTGRCVEVVDKKLLALCN